MSRTVHHALAALTLLVVVASVAFPPAVAATTAGGPVIRSTPRDAGNTTNVTTTVVHQRNPDTVDQKANDSALSSWLRGRMASLLGNASVQIGRGQYQRATRSLGGQYDGYLRKYVHVTGGTPSESPVAAAFNRTQRDERAYATTAARYNRTARAYRRARAAGNETRARHLARRLDALNHRLNRTSANVTRSYRTLGNRTGIPVANETRAIRSATNRTTARTAKILREAFIRTTVVASTRGTTASFARPVTIRGAVRTSNGTAPAARVTLVVGSQRARVPLSSSGAFSLAYRPVDARVGTRPIRVAYVPANGSAYLGNTTATAPVSIRQTNPRMTVSASPSRVGYGGTLTLEGSVRANGTGVPDAPVHLTVAGTRLGVARTAANGSYRETVRVPASVPNGTRTVRAVERRAGRAIGPANATASLAVTPTPTHLTVRARRRGASVVVSGVLSADGHGLSDRSVDVSANGTLFASVTTNATGGYRDRVRASALPGGGPVALTTAFDGGSTSLGASRASARVPAAPRGTSSTPTIPLVGGVVALALVGLGAGVRYWYRRRQRAAASPGAAETVNAPSERDDRADAESAVERGRATIQEAAKLVEDDPGAAVEASYAAVRSAFDGRVEGAPLTHWEFVAAAKATDDLSADRVSAFRTLTAAYETAAFSSVALDAARATDALDAARRALDGANESAD